ncbi:hypothetical protein D3C78_1027530 [compost metagenome]
MQKRAEPLRQLFLLAEIDNMQRTARFYCRERLFDRLFPVRYHRQRIGDHDAVEALGLAEFRSTEGGGIGHAQNGAFRLAGEILGCGQQHFGGNVEAKQFRVRKLAAGQQQVAAGAAADFQQGAALRHVEAGNGSVATEKVIFAGNIVDMPLVAIHAVHQARMRAVCKTHIFADGFHAIALS